MHRASQERLDQIKSIIKIIVSCCPECHIVEPCVSTYSVFHSLSLHPSKVRPKIRYCGQHLARSSRRCICQLRLKCPFTRPAELLLPRCRHGLNTLRLDEDMAVSRTEERERARLELDCVTSHWCVEPTQTEGERMSSSIYAASILVICKHICCRAS